MIMVQRRLVTSKQQVILQPCRQRPLGGFANGNIFCRNHSIESFRKYPHGLRVFGDVLRIAIATELRN